MDTQVQLLASALFGGARGRPEHAVIMLTIGIAYVVRMAVALVLGGGQLSLAVEAVKNALDDAGLAKSQINGLLTSPGNTAPEDACHYLRLGETLGIDP